MQIVVIKLTSNDCRDPTADRKLYVDHTTDEATSTRFYLSRQRPAWRSYLHETADESQPRGRASHTQGMTDASCPAKRPVSAAGSGLKWLEIQFKTQFKRSLSTGEKRETSNLRTHLAINQIKLNQLTWSRARARARCPES